MKTPLRVLIVEDTPDDAELTLRELRRGGYDPDFERVETPEEMAGALKQQDWEVILCDYTMPAFSAPKALELLTRTGVDIPFIVVSGKIGEETAVEMMRAGAHDYVMKGNLTRLAAAVKRELAEAHIRREREQAEEELRLGAQRWQITFESVADAICLLDSQANVLQSNSAMGKLTGRQPAQLVGRKCCKLLHGSPEHVEDCPFERACSSLQREELELVVADRWLRITVDPLKDANGKVSGAVHTATDITERKRAEEEIANLAKFPAESPDPILRATRDGTIIFANNAALPLLDAWSNQNQQGAVLPPEWSKLVGDVLVSGQTEDVEIECDGRAFLVTFAPVVEGGYVNLYARDITERKRAEEALRKTMVDTVDTLASVVEQRDPYTSGHQRRVAQLACAIAEEMHFSQERVHGVHLAGIIHDVGKISVPAEILTKPGRLTETELSLVKTHPQAGSDVLQRIVFPWPIAQVVLQHHERMDGSGYPQGLSGEDILLEARILAVADVVEAMASHRPYRPALGTDKALSEILEAKGTLYDPDAVDACLKLFGEKGFKFD